MGEIIRGLSVARLVVLAAGIYSMNAYLLAISLLFSDGDKVNSKD